MNGESIDFSGFDSAVANLRKQMEEKIAIPTLDRVNTEIESFKKKIDFAPLTDAFEKLKSDIVNRETTYKKDLEDQLATLKQNLSDSRGLTKDKLADISDHIVKVQEKLTVLAEKKPQEIPDFATQIRESETRLKALIESDKYNDTEVRKQVDDLDKLLKRFREELSNRGGGNMNRQVLFNSTNYLKKFTDYNLIPGNNVTFTITEDATHKRVNLTINATGGSGSGITRVITNVAVNTAAGSASTTDYVYLCAGTLTVTLPTSIGNSNLYTIKNIGAGTVTVNTTGGETIDGDLTVIMPVQYTSVDLVSNNSGNWNVT